MHPNVACVWTCGLWPRCAWAEGDEGSSLASLPPGLLTVCCGDFIPGCIDYVVRVLRDIKVGFDVDRAELEEGDDARYFVVVHNDDVHTQDEVGAGAR